MRSMPLPNSTSQRLMAAIALLVGLLVCAVLLAVLDIRASTTAVNRLANEELERISLVGEISDNANDVARKLVVLANAPRDMRVLAYTEIDAANRRLDAAMVLLAKNIERGVANVNYRSLAESIKVFRVAYQDTADIIESEDVPAAQQKVVQTVDFELSALISATQNLDRTERQQAAALVQGLRVELARNQQVMLALAGAGLALAGLLSWWVARHVAAPMRAAAQVARQLAHGDYGARLPAMRTGEMADIATAFEQLATEVQQREQALRRLIDVDPLTGLPQRNRFLADQGHRLNAALQGGPPLLLLCYDIERLKTINSLLGFDAGDAVIVSAAKHLNGQLGLHGAVARLGGGTFAALIELQPGETPLSRAAAFRSQVEHQVEWQSHALDVAVAIGLAVGPEHAQTLPELLRRAEQALYEGKRQRGTLGQYSPSIEAARLVHLSMLSDLQRAIEQHQLVPFLQPKLNLATGCITGAEALVRWRHPQRGWVPPGEFIPFAEQSGRISSITQDMLRQCVELLATTLPHMTIAVNISTQDLRDSEFAPRLGALLAERGVSPSRLQVEVTESGLLDSGSQPIDCLHALRALGVGIAIDDFGTGQSSLAYLQKLPAHELKIDRSFVHGVGDEPKRRELLGAIVRLGHSLGLTVTAEGVETEAELEVLRHAGCDLAQGYLIARPMPVEEFARRFGAANADEAQLQPANA